MKSKPLTLVVLSLAIMMIVASFAEGGLLCGRFAQRRAERREARQAARHMACGNNIAVVHHAQPVASYGGCQDCGCGQSVQVAPQQTAYAQPVITYAPVSSEGAMSWGQVFDSGTGGGQCRLVNGKWQCGS